MSRQVSLLMRRYAKVDRLVYLGANLVNSGIKSEIKSEHGKSQRVNRNGLRQHSRPQFIFKIRA